MHSKKEYNLKFTFKQITDIQTCTFIQKIYKVSCIYKFILKNNNNNNIKKTKRINAFKHALSLKKIKSKFHTFIYVFCLKKTKSKFMLKQNQSFMHSYMHFFQKNKIKIHIKIKSKFHAFIYAFLFQKKKKTKSKLILNKKKKKKK